MNKGIRKVGKPTNFVKARKLTIALLDNNPDIRAAEVFRYLNKVLDEKEVPSLQHIARNWVNKYKPRVSYNWLHTLNIHRQIKIIEKELSTLKKLIKGDGNE
tara:strand:+ start:2151 stop:2456 length:306 start_codon:yes stop_codon:yes gene_type:complete